MLRALEKFEQSMTVIHDRKYFLNIVIFGPKGECFEDLWG